MITLSKLVELKIKRLLGSRNPNSEEAVARLKLWLESKVVEQLPNGIFYKVCDNRLLNKTAGVFVGASKLGSFNYPLIFVSARFTPTERRAIAMHEFIEWSKQRNLSGEKLDTHYRVLMDERLREAFGLKRRFPNLVGVYSEPHFDALRRENPRLRRDVDNKRVKM